MQGACTGAAHETEWHMHCGGLESTSLSGAHLGSRVVALVSVVLEPAAQGLSEGAVVKQEG